MKQKMGKNEIPLIQTLFLMVILGILTVVFVPKFIQPKSEKQEEKGYNYYEITEVGFDGFLITAFYSDPNYGYINCLNLALHELELKGYEIRLIVPSSYGDDGQLQAIWVRTKKREEISSSEKTFHGW